MSQDRSDQQLAERVRHGDGDALRTLWDRHAPALHQLAFRLLRSRDDADDVVQDVFVGLRAALGHYSDEGRFDGWLRQVVTRAALMRLRGDRRRESRAQVAELTSATPIQPDVALESALSRAIDALPQTLHTVFVLRMIEERSYDEIAALLGVSVSACKVRLHRALRRLRPQLRHLREDR